MTDNHAKATKPRKAIGRCRECGGLVYIRRDNSAYKHRLPMGAPDQLCDGSGYPVTFVRFEDKRAKP